MAEILDLFNAANSLKTPLEEPKYFSLKEKLGFMRKQLFLDHIAGSKVAGYQHRIITNIILEIESSLKSDIKVLEKMEETMTPELYREAFNWYSSNIKK
jgi:hypothetical protein